MYKFESVPLTISSILKNAWELYKISIHCVMPWTFIISILHVIPNSYNMVGFYQLRSPHHYPVFSGWALLLYLVLLVIEAYCIGVLFYNLYFLVQEQKLHLGRSLKKAFTQLIPLYIAIVIYFFVVNLSMFLLLLPAVFCAVILAMFIPFILIEKQSIYTAFKSSVRLVWGSWWQTFFVLVVPYLVTYLGRSFVRFSYLDVSRHWVMIIDTMLLMLSLPYFYSALLIQYNNLKIIKSLPDPITSRPRTENKL